LFFHRFLVVPKPAFWHNCEMSKCADQNADAPCSVPPTAQPNCAQKVSPTGTVSETSGLSGPESGATPSLSEGSPQRRSREIGGPSGPEPTRYGDWEKKGRCIDF
jgi:hypothetical protein